MPPPSLLPSNTILLPDLPPKTLVGIDLITFTSTQNFHGIRDLPEGWHFLYTGTTESFSLRSGAWLYVGDHSAAIMATRNPGPEVLIWKWNTDIEALVPLKGDNDADIQEAMRRKANLGSVWRSGLLFRYRSRVPPSYSNNNNGSAGTSVAGQDFDDEENEEEGGRVWDQLTCYISPRLLSRVVGNPAVDNDGRPRWTVTSASSANRDADVIPGLEGRALQEAVGKAEGDLELEFKFLPVDLKRTWREGAIGRERTESAQDRSWALGDLIRRYSSESPDQGTRANADIDMDGHEGRSGEKQILGELQFTFLMVLTMMNYSCLQQWKRLLSLVLTCRSAIREREQFMADFIGLLSQQLQRCDDVEGGLFEMDGDGGGEFLRKLLMKFKQSVQEIVDGTMSAVKYELDKLEAWVKEEYDWDLDRVHIVRRGMVQLEDGEEVELEMNGDEDEETGEYAPVVVDMGEGHSIQDVDMGKPTG